MLTSRIAHRPGEQPVRGILSTLGQLSSMMRSGNVPRRSKDLGTHSQFLAGLGGQSKLRSLANLKQAYRQLN